MTWKELKQSIESFTEEQQNEQVYAWGTVTPFSEEVKLRVAKENYYWNSEWDSSRIESDLEEYDKENGDTFIICEKGKPYLYVCEP